MSAQAAEPTFRQAQNRHSASGNPCHHFVYHRLTCDQYDELLARAGGHCEMCETAESETGGQRLVVDHFQWSQPRIRVVRGMVCDACNSAMSCLDGNKRWGPRRGVLEPRARAYQARVLRDLPLAELALIERMQEQRQMRIARPSRPMSSKEKTDERQPSGQRGDHDMSERTFDAALGSRLRDLRERQGLTREEVARRLAQYGVATSRPSVGVTENGQRSVKAYELLVLPRVFGISLDDLLRGLPEPEPAPAGPDEATVKAARRLGRAPEEVDATARQLWGRTLTDEREARIGEAPRTRADQARRGHITRQLIDELRTVSASPVRPDEEPTP